MSTPQAQSWLQQGLAHHQAGRLVQAKGCYETTLRLNPGEAEAWRLLGVLYQGSGDAAAALGCLEKAAALRPASPEIHYTRGNLLGASGRAEEALQSYREALRLRPRFPEAHCNAGATLLGAARFSEAAEAFTRAVELDPRNTTYLLNLAIAQRRAGRPEESVRAARQAIKREPRNPACLSELGLGLRAQGKIEEAEQAFLQAMQTGGDCADAACNLGQMLFDRGRVTAALQAFESALRVRPDHGASMLGRGNCLYSLGDSAAAEAGLRQAVAHRAGAQALNSLGVLLLKEGRLSEALEQLRAAHEQEPSDHEITTNLGWCLVRTRRHEEAEQVLRGVLASRPEHPRALSNLGVTLMMLGRLEESEQVLRRAHASDPTLADPLSNLGNVLQALGRHAEALPAYDDALSRDAGLSGARFNRAVARLLLGELRQAWADYEARPGLAQLHLHPAARSPRWTGAESLAGCSIHIIAEQGLGDTLQFVRYLSLLRDRGARVQLEAQAPLLPLLSRAGFADSYLAQGQLGAPCDFHCPLLSLPGAFATELAEIPAPSSYLQAREDRVEAWRLELGPLGTLRAGLVWCGNPRHENDHNRSIAYSEYRYILETSDVSFVSLQKECRETEQGPVRSDAQSGLLLDLATRLTDFEETAAVLANLELLITVDTSVAHLAAAMGRPVWLLLPFNPDWRWQLGRKDSPWYPSMRLFRQKSPGDWTGVLERVRMALVAMAHENS